MSNRRRLCLTLALTAVSVISGGCRTAPTRREVARIVQSIGAVHVTPAGGLPLVKAGVGAPLRARDKVVTGSDAWAFIAFSDGPKVLVGQGAEFLIEDVTEHDIFLLLRYASLGARLGKTPGRRMTLRTPSATANLRPGDCTFRLQVDSATGGSVWDVVEGKLRLRDNFGREVLVRAGERVSADTERGFAGRNPLPFPPDPRVPARAVRPVPEQAQSPKSGLYLPPNPPKPAALPETGRPTSTATGPVSGMSFPPVPRFEEMDALLEDLNWIR